MTDQQLTILHYIPRIDRGSGGLGSYIQALSKELGRRSRLHVLTHKGNDDLPLECCTVSYMSSIWPSFLTKREFKAVLDRIHPDVVHISTCWMPLSAYTAIWAKEYGYKVVLTPHGMLDPLIISHNYWTRKLPAILAYQRRAISMADVIIATSAHEKTNLEKLGWNRNIEIVPNGVESGLIRMKDFGQTAKRILYLGRIHPHKGLNHLIEAVSAIKPLLVSNGYSVNIVGMGDKAYTEKLHTMISNMGVSDIVSITGPAYEKEKRKLYEKARVLVLPSYSESFGLVIAESLAYGTPVITTQGTPWEEIEGAGNPETGKHEGKCGWWIESGTQPLADTLKSFLDTSDDELREMGENGVRLIEEKYSTTRMVDMNTDIYNRIKI